MKRFDFAGEVSKQLITICAAIITVVIAFYEKFFSHANWTFYFVLFDLALFVFSIFAGVWSLGGVANLVEHQEYRDAASERANSKSKLRPVVPKGFVRISGSRASLWARWQQIFFLLALSSFVLVAVVDRATTTSAPPKPASNEGKQKGRYRETDHVKTFYLINRYPRD
jgi:hypothetical protein